MSDNSNNFKEVLLKNSKTNSESQKYFLLFLKIEKMLKEEKYRWLSNNKLFMEIRQKPFIYLDKRLFNSVLNFALWCFIAHLLIMPLYTVSNFPDLKQYYGLATVLNGAILHFFMSFRIKRLMLLSINVAFDRSVMDKQFFNKLLEAIPDDRLQDKKDMLDILSKYSYGYTGVKKYMYVLAYKIMNSAQKTTID